MTRNELIKFILLRSIGNFLVLFAIYGIFATFGPALYYEFQYRIIQARGVHYAVGTPEVAIQNLPNEQRQLPNTSFANVLAGPKEQILIPSDTNFSIVIPKIGASAKVFPNVDPGNRDEFLPILQQGIAHAKGTVFPGVPGNTYLFAHSTDNFWDVGRYNAVFYLLKDLTVGDEIVVFFEGKRYDYKVYDTKIVDDSDISYIVHSQDPNSPQRLILQTCWPPGTSWKRLIVFAAPK